MSRRLALVTGVTSGIGREVALGLVRLGYDLCVIARNEAKVNDLRRDATALRADIQVDYHNADLSLVASTKAAVAQIASVVDRVDLLYYSAALVPGTLELTAEGLEKCFAVSYLSRVIITDAMLPALLSSDDKLLLAVASPGMKATVDFDDVNFVRRPFKTMDVLGQFQHANDVYFTHLAEKHRGAGLRAYVYHPGMVDTPIHQNWSGPVGFFMRYLMRPMMISPQQSAHAALEVVGGSLTPDSPMFNHKGKSLPVPEGVRDEAYRQRVVAFSRDLVTRRQVTPRPFPPVRPHGEIEEVFPDVFRVPGSIEFGPLRFSRNMTVIRQGDGLVLINTVRLDEAGLAALDALGQVRHILRIGGWHGSDDAFYKDRYGCPVTKVKGQRYFEGTTAEKGNTYFESDHEMDADSELPIEGASLYVIHTTPPEAILRIPAGGGTLITSDALQHWPRTDDRFNFLGRVGMTLGGVVKPLTMMKPWVDKYHPPREEIAGILELGFDNVLPGHGVAVIGDAREKFRPALEAYAGRA